METAGLDGEGLKVSYCRNGQSNKMTGSMVLAGEKYGISFELHLCGPRGGTFKALHQFAGHDIEREPAFPGFEVKAPPSFLFFIACHLSGAGVSIDRAFLKFADGVDQRKIEIFRDAWPDAAGVAGGAPAEGPEDVKLKVKKPKGDQERYGGKTNQRGDAASSSKEA